MSTPDVVEMTDFISDEYGGDFVEEVLLRTGVTIPDTDNYYNVYVLPFMVKELARYVADDATSGAGLQVCLKNSGSTTRVNYKLQFYNATSDDEDKCSVRVYCNVGGAYNATNHTNELVLNTLYYMIVSLQWNDDNPDTIVCKTRISISPSSDGTIQSEEKTGSDPTDIDRITLNLLGWSSDFCRVQVWEMSLLENVANTELPKTQHHIQGYIGQMTAADFTAATTHGRLLTHWNQDDWNLHYTTSEVEDAADSSLDNYTELTDEEYGLPEIKTTSDAIEVSTTYTEDTVGDVFEPSDGEHNHDLMQPFSDFINDDNTLTPPTYFPPVGGEAEVDMYGYGHAIPDEEEVT